MDSIDLSKVKLPPIYKRNGRECYLDPIRQKLIYITPEETVRQKVIAYLLQKLHVPKNMVIVEEHLSHYGLKSKDRADIVIRAITKDNEEVPLAVVECKAETVDLDERAFQQAQGYSDALGCIYTVLINGIRDFTFMYDEKTNEYVQIKTLPTYKEMLAGDYVQEDLGELPPRIPYDKLEEELKNEFKDAGDDYYLMDISRHTPFNMALPLFNLWEGLLDIRVKMPTGDYGIFKLIEDYGVRLLSYGNGSGGHFFGPYRSFLVDVNGNTEFYSIGFGTYWKSGWDLNEKPPMTCISVAHDDEKVSHHALQLVAEDNVVVIGKKLKFYHHGRIAIGRIGSGKKVELMEMVSEKYPKIVDGNRYYLGEINSDHLLRLDEPDVIDLVVNLISYSIVRDEYREKVKEEKSK